MTMPLALRVLGLHPKKLGSGCVGVLARIPLPPGARGALLGAFARRYAVDLGEAEKPLGEYRSFLDFFTRRLAPGVRPQAPAAPGGIDSPVDGAVIGGGAIESGTLIQAKGLPYALAELLPGEPHAARFAGGWYATLYLSPRDYHRIHVPAPGRCVGVGRVEGELWPVNELSTAHVPRLYARNRRAWWIAEGTGSCEGLVLGVVMVAATHVGGVVVDARWLSGRTLPRTGRLDVAGLPAEPGDDLGVFELGSTVVLLVGGPRAAGWRAERTEGRILVGQRLGAFAP
jgi:phosphatidylserine decarboxylase